MIRKFGYIFITLLTGLGFLACSPRLFKSEYSTQEPCGFVLNIYGERISWKGHLPVELKIHQSVPREMVQAVHDAVATWNKAMNKKLFEIVDENFPGPVLPRKDNQNVIYWNYAWDTPKSDEQARTNVFWIGDEIREADILLNAEYSFYSDQYATVKQIDLVSVMLHEMGHVLGLKHNDASKSVMATYLQPLQERREILTNDMESVRCEY